MWWQAYMVLDGAQWSNEAILVPQPLPLVGREHPAFRVPDKGIGASPHWPRASNARLGIGGPMASDVGSQ